MTTKIYDIRAAKERKRRANGPFVKPTFHPVPDITARTLPAQTAPSREVPSDSSGSIYPEPSLSSLHSSQTRGSGFIPSHQTSPALAECGSVTSDSCSPGNPLWDPITQALEKPFVPDHYTDVGGSPPTLSGSDV